MFRFIRNKRPAIVGLMFGGTIGLTVAVAYAATAGWLCSGIRACPARWEPYAIVSSIIFFGITVAGVIVAVIGARLYKIFDTAPYDESVVTTYPGRESASGTFSERPEGEG